uniref:Uncharacterized protein n=1 Tax=Panagrolaimus sp. PS1159 TaxID=55785 RepID=A0AC35F7X3_9BILA
MGTLVFGLIKYQPVRLDAYDYDFPVWGHVFGWFLSLSSMLCIPVYAIYLWIVTDGTTSEKFEKLFRPEVDLTPDKEEFPEDGQQMYEF